MTAWHWECFVIAPSGEPIPGMSGGTEHAALAELFPRLEQWRFAQAQGYALRWLRTENDEDADYPAEEVFGPLPSRIAGKITIGRGARWG